MAAKANPLRAREAIKGSPSPSKVLTRTATQTRDKALRLIVSVRESAVDVTWFDMPKGCALS